MKQLAFILIGLIILCGCNEYIDISGYSPDLTSWGQHYFSTDIGSSLENDFKNVQSSGQSWDIYIESKDCNWKFTDVPDWITISPMSGNNSCKVNIKIKENFDPYFRVGMFCIEAKGRYVDISYTLTINQRPAPSYFEISEDHDNCYEIKNRYSRFWCSGKEQTLIIPLKTNQSYIEARKSKSFESNTPWVTADCDNENHLLIINVEENNTDRCRQVWFEFYDRNRIYKDVYLIQHKNGLSILSTDKDSDINGWLSGSSGDYTHPKDGGTYSFMIRSDSSWYTRCDTEDGDPPYFKVSPSKGEEGFYEITVDFEPTIEYRSDGYINFYIGEDKQARFHIW